MPDVLLTDGGNFLDFPTGGHLSMARQLMRAFGNRLALIGLSTDSTPVGRWVKKRIDGVTYDFFAIGCVKTSATRPLVPARITNYLRLRKCRQAILSLGVKSIFIQSPQTLFAVEDWGWDSICYCCAGVANPLANSRYRWGRSFAGVFQRKWTASLSRVDTVLASADDAAIDEFVMRSRGKLKRGDITSFPTRVDTVAFRPLNKTVARTELGMANDVPIIANCGRLNRVKGWDLLLDSLRVFLDETGRGQLIFIGDGEDRKKLEARAAELRLTPHIRVTGFVSPEQVARYLGAADVCAVGSHKEGWSVAMLEAIACGMAIVSTDVSGARSLIRDGENGYVLSNRDPVLFACALKNAMVLKHSRQVSRAVAEQYAVERLAADLGSLWLPLG